jgi:AcrR family transcriptional regulator
VSQETAQNLVAAVEQLLVDKGHAGFTLRDITEMAGANVASVAYHFGSKDQLVEQVFRDSLIEVTAAQEKRIAALPESATIDEVVTMWLSPALDPNPRDAREAMLWSLIQRGAIERAPALLSSMVDMVASFDNALMRRFATLLPHLTIEEVRLRHDLVIGGLSAVKSGPMIGDGSAAIPSTAIVAWAVAGLTAPPTPIQ